MSVTVTVFLTDPEHSRAWRAVQSEADAINRIRGAKVVQFDLAAEPELGTLEAIFALTNDVCDTDAQDRAAVEYRRDGETRSLSVGDIVHVSGLGIFSVGPVGWQRHDHRLTANAAAHAVRVAYGITA
jgi:hypothetical protein